MRMVKSSTVIPVPPTSLATTYKIFPNPANGAVYLSVPTGSVVSMMIYDIAGELMYENNIYISNNVITTNN